MSCAHSSWRKDLWRYVFEKFKHIYAYLPAGYKSGPDCGVVVSELQYLTPGRNDNATSCMCAPVGPLVDGKCIKAGAPPILAWNGFDLQDQLHSWVKDKMANIWLSLRVKDTQEEITRDTKETWTLLCQSHVRDPQFHLYLHPLYTAWAAEHQYLTSSGWDWTGLPCQI